MKYSISVILLTCILLLFSGCSQKIDSSSVSEYKVNLPQIEGEARDIDFELAIPFPDLPDELPVYKRVKPDITAEYVADLGKKIGIEGEVTNNQENIFVMYDANTTADLRIYKTTGAIVLNYKASDKLFPEEPPELPSYDEAGDVATAFLNKLGLLPEGVGVSWVGVGGSYGDIETGIPAHLAVSFDYRFNGYALTGQGKKYSVRIGNKGEVVAMMFHPVQGEPYDTVKIKSVETAYQEMLADKNYGAPIMAEEVKIDDISIAYWLDVISQSQEYIIPVFVFKGTCLDAEGKEIRDKFTVWVEAVQ